MEYMDIGEFIEFGYLQEVNRQFFHPYGLALEVSKVHYGIIERMRRAWGVIRGDGEAWAFSGVWDCRDDPEGIIFADGVMTETKRNNVIASVKDINRLKKLGFVIQPVE